MDEVLIGIGFDEHERTRVGELYWTAFGAKLTAGFGDAATGRRAVTDALASGHLLVARIDGHPVGVCGFHQAHQGALDLTWRRLRSHLSRARTAWALASLSLLSRHGGSDALVLDGICVDEAYRSRGVGTRLLEASYERARSAGADWVQLSVVDANPRAAALYRRAGFQPVSHGTLGPLRHLYGFNGHTTMRRRAVA